MTHGAVLSPPDRAQGDRPIVWVVEDDPAVADLAVDLCRQGGAEAEGFRAPLPYLDALRNGHAPPAAVILDWRLEHELSSALFMATRHRYPDLPVIYWTASDEASLPTMIRQDPRSRIVEKSHGMLAFEAALSWALAVAEAEKGPPTDAA